MPEHLHFLSHAATDIGRQRSANQDAVNVYQPAEDDIEHYQRGFLYVLSDGMGGHKAGEVASGYSVDALVYHYYESSWQSVHENLEQAYRDVNHEVYEKQLSESIYKGMGATLVVAALRDNQLDVANVGDSRAYLLRDNRLIQLTHDHSWVAEKVRSGELDPALAEDHPNKSWITRNIGGEAWVEPDIFTETIYAGDTILLCSDGLSGPVPEGQIQEILIEYWRNPAGATRALIDLANEYGGPDNIAAIVINIVANGATQQDQFATLTRLPDDVTVPLPRFQKRSRVSTGLRQVQDLIPANPLFIIGIAIIFLFCVGISTITALWIFNSSNGESNADGLPTATLAPIVTHDLANLPGAGGVVETETPTPTTTIPTLTPTSTSTVAIESSATATTAPTETPVTTLLLKPEDVRNVWQETQFSSPPDNGRSWELRDRTVNGATIGTDELGEQWAFICGTSICVYGKDDNDAEDIGVNTANVENLVYIHGTNPPQQLEKDQVTFILDDQLQRLSWSWAPDDSSERKLAFVCNITIDDDSSLDICIYEKANKTLTVLGAPGSDEVDPAWSKENYLLFASKEVGNDENHILYKVNYPLIDPTNEQPTNPDGRKNLLEDYGIVLFDESSRDFRWPSSARSADLIAFQATGCPGIAAPDDPNCEDFDIYLIIKEGNGIYKIDLDYLPDENPALSPDGKYLAFARSSVAGSPPKIVAESDLIIVDLSTDCFEQESPEIFCDSHGELKKMIQGSEQVSPRLFWVSQP